MLLLSKVFINLGEINFKNSVVYLEEFSVLVYLSVYLSYVSLICVCSLFALLSYRGRVEF